MRVAAAPTVGTVQPLTRAELRRRAAQHDTFADSAPESSSSAPAAVVPDIDVSGLTVPSIPEVATPVEAAASALDAAPVPGDAPALPPTFSRRARNRRRLHDEVAPLGAPAVTPADLAVDEPAAVGPSTVNADAGDSPVPDEFEAAARLFAFTAETPAQSVAAAPADGVDVTYPAEALPQPAAARRRFPVKRFAAASFSLGVMGVIGLLTVGMTTPVEAVAVAKGATTAGILAPAGDVADDGTEIQAYIAPAEVQNGAVERSDAFATTTLAEMAAESGISNFSSFFVNDPTAAIQWPFAVGVPITYGFGMRSGTMHEGADFVPGAGAPVQAIADGTVRIATESGGAYGVTVLIDHVIDGALVSSRYAHLQYGSLRVSPGQRVTVGTVIGRTGNTGRSYGAHLHLEILAGGTTPIDPIAWLRQHAGG